MAEDKKTVDWALLEVDYRAGLKTLQQIGAEYGVTKGRISQVAKKQGWARDLAKKIAQRTEQKLNEAAVNKELNSPKVRLAESQVIEANAELQSSVIMRHRGGLVRLGALRDKLLAEIEAVTDNTELFENLGELMDESGEDATGKFKQDKRNELYRKIISVSGRIDDAKKLAEIDERVRKGEREAHGLDKGEEQKQSSVDALLRKINESA